MSGWGYIPKVGRVYVVTLPATNAWTPIVTAAQLKGSRGIKVKSRFVLGQTTQKNFDYAFSATPNTTDAVTDGTGFVSNTGSGFGDVFSPTSGIWARTTQSGVVLEILVYD